MTNNGCWLRRDVKHDVYRCYDLSGRLLYIGHTNRWPGRRWLHRRDSPWWGQTVKVTFEPYPNRVAAHSAEQAAIRAERPLHNKERYGGEPPEGLVVTRGKSLYVANPLPEEGA